MQSFPTIKISMVVVDKEEERDEILEIVIAVFFLCGFKALRNKLWR